MNIRKILNEYFIEMAFTTATRSTCLRGSVGAILVRDNMLLSTGYNGAPIGMPHCTDPGVGCLLYNSKSPDGSIQVNCFRIVHAEMNAILNAAKNGININNTVLYCTHSPCYHCCKTLINLNVKKMFYVKPYNLDHISELVQLANIDLIQIEKK